MAAAATSCLRQLPPENATAASLLLLGTVAPRLGPKALPSSLRTTVCGLTFSSPVGFAAGFDKDARALRGLARLGLGFVEAGTVTPAPQAGNPKPRVFRLHSDQAHINRLGFPSKGLDVFCRNLARYRARADHRDCVIGVNIGVNRESDDPPADFARSLVRVAPLADYVTINLSSPNTPGLRDWQEGDPLARLLDAIGNARSGLATDPPVLIKLSPDLAEDGLVATVGHLRRAPIDGLILTNTTTARPPGLRGRRRDEAGGLSGRPLAPLALQALRTAYRVCGGAMPLIGVGGIDSAEAAYARIRAGASLIQLYTALTYQGPGLIEGITKGLATRLTEDGFASIADAVGAENDTERAPAGEARSAAAARPRSARAPRG